jgi:glycogen debranching enzyme
LTTRRILFDPEDYRELDQGERALLAKAYEQAKVALYKNITPKGFSACSLADNQVFGTDINYRSIWARDGAMTVIWSLDLDEEPVRECSARTLRTLLSHQSPTGQIPANVRIETDEPEYAGVGGIASIDSPMWLVIALWRFCKRTGDWSIIHDYRDGLQRTMDWLSAHDSNNCGMIEVPEAGDWTDLFARSYHVLYDEVLWFRSLVCYAMILSELGETERAKDYAKWADHVRAVIIRSFWPTTVRVAGEEVRFTSAQFSLGDARYLVAQLSPFGFSWRCDVFGNILAYLNNLITREQAMQTFQFLWGVGVNDPGPVRNLYPPVYAGDPEWRNYFTVNLLNLPNHYHNGGIWPFIGGLWVRFLHRLGMIGLARREMVKLAQLCSHGVSNEWEFNEWHHGVTGRAMGKAFQAWSAASFIQAAHELHVQQNGNLDHE